MVNRTITAPATVSTTVNGVTITDGSATVDDATPQGKRVIAFAKRQGWGVSGGIATANPKTVAEGKPVADWTVAELKAYLDARKVQYPSGALKPALLAAVQDAFEVKAQGGSAVNESAGHTSGSMPPEGAPPVSAPSKPDDADEAARWVTPQGGNLLTDVAPTISVQPADDSVTAPAPGEFAVTAAGTPAPSYQWQRSDDDGDTWEDIDGETAATLTTDATTVGDNGAQFRVVVSNTDGEVTSDAATLTVTA